MSAVKLNFLFQEINVYKIVYVQNNELQESTYSLSFYEALKSAATTELCTSRNVKSILCPAGRRKQVAMRFPERARRQAASCREVLA